MIEPLVIEPRVETTLLPQPSVARRVIASSVWSVSGQCVTLLASLVATPIVLRLLGAESYGLLALINLLIGYLAFTDIGMGVASTRFGARASAQHESGREEAAVVWTALLIAALPTLVTAGLLALMARPLVEQVLHLPRDLHEQAIAALRLTAVAFVARSLSGVLNTPQLVRLRLDLFTVITAGTSILQICLIPVVLAFGGGLIAAVSVIAGASLMALLLHAVVSWRLLPSLARPRVSPTLFRPLLRFSSAVIISSIVGMILLSAEKLLLTRFSSVAALAHYSVAYTLANLLLVIPAAINQSLMPAFSRLQASPDRMALAQLYRWALRGNLLWLMPAAAVLGITAQPFITIWAGPAYADAVTPFYILIVGLLFNVMAFVPFSLLTALGHTNLIARYHLLELVPYLLGAAVLTYLFGATGAALTWSLRLIADALLIFRAARRTSGFDIAPSRGKSLTYAFGLAMLVLPVLFLISVGSSLLVRGLVITGAILGYGIIIWRQELSMEERARLLLWWHHWQRRFGQG